MTALYASSITQSRLNTYEQIFVSERSSTHMCVLSYLLMYLPYKSVGFSPIFSSRGNSSYICTNHCSIVGFFFITECKYACFHNHSKFTLYSLSACNNFNSSSRYFNDSSLSCSISHFTSCSQPSIFILSILTDHDLLSSIYN